MDNKLSIHFGEDKTISVTFASECKQRKVPKLNITYKNIQIEQNSKATNLVYILDEKMVEELMSLKVINKIDSRYKFLQRKKKFLTP